MIYIRFNTFTVKKVLQFFCDVFDMESKWNLIESLVNYLQIHANYTSLKYILCNWLQEKELQLFSMAVWTGNLKEHHEYVYFNTISDLFFAFSDITSVQYSVSNSGGMWPILWNSVRHESPHHRKKSQTSNHSRLGHLGRCRVPIARIQESTRKTLEKPRGKMVWRLGLEYKRWGWRISISQTVTCGLLDLCFGYPLLYTHHSNDRGLLWYNKDTLVH